MFKNRYIKDWLITSALTFVLYEVFWLFGVEEPLSINDWDVVGVDLVFCGIFAASSMGIGKVLSKFPYFKRFILRRQLILCILMLAINLALAYLFENVYEHLLPDPMQDESYRGIYLFCLVATLLTAFHVVVRYYKIIIEQKEQLSQLRKQVLKNKLDPHFVFNTLSTLTELIHQNPSQAEKYSIHISRIYRFLLDDIDKDYITVSGSLDFVQEYVKPLKYRVEGKIELELGNLASTTNEYLYPLALQTLVENAIKHNPPGLGETLRITITRDANEIVVRNNILEATNHEKSFGIGLKALSLQYGMDNLPQPQVRQTDDSFEVRMQIIKKKDNAENTYNRG